jgi:hypothetical protein
MTAEQIITSNLSKAKKAIVEHYKSVSTCGIAFMRKSSAK